MAAVVQDPSEGGPLSVVPPTLLVLGSVTSVQFGAALAATMFDEIGPAGATLLRLLLSGVIVMAIWRPHPRDFRHPGAWRIAIAYGLVLGLMNLLFYEALVRIPLGIAVTLEFAGPLTIAVVGSRKRLDVLWVGLATAGIVLLGLRASGGGADGLDPVGVAYAAGAAVCWGGYIVIAQRLGDHIPGGAGLSAGMMIAALVPLGPGIAGGGIELLDPALVAQGLAVAILSSVIPYTFEFEALRRMARHVFGVLMSVEPALAALAGFLVLGQRLAVRDLVAIGLVVAASVGAASSATGRPPVVPAEP